MRRPRRYLSLRILSDRAFAGEHFMDALEESVGNFFGEFGLSKMSLSLISLDPSIGHAIVRCSLRGMNELRFSASLLRDIAGTPCVVFSEQSSGTLKALRGSSSATQKNKSQEKSPRKPMASVVGGIGESSLSIE